MNKNYKTPLAFRMPSSSNWKQLRVTPSELVDYGSDYMPCHDEGQIEVIKKTIKIVGFDLPVVTDGQDSIISGPGRVEAAKRLQLPDIPTLPLQWMTEQERRLLVFGMIRLARLGNWTPEIYRIDIRILSESRLNTEFKINGKFCDARGNCYLPQTKRVA